MRKIHTNQILSILGTFRQALDYIQKRGSKDLLADLRKNIDPLSDFIVQVKGQDTQTGRLLAGFQAEIGSAAAAKNFGHAQIKALWKSLNAIESTAKEELKPDRIEVAFFPYKADMWDCLESIYLAAKADPACDVYCVPIPWYDKRPNGSLGAEHYEGGLYPANIEITDYKKYAVGARRPDVIFVHNPYDNSNHVTSVHPAFYCERLRGMTDCLVYVPYFVLSGDVPHHFVTIPGCAFAHRVIVQSEETRATYIRVFKEKFGDKFGKPELKFIALGSPKFDKALQTKREDCVIPEEWQRSLASADGSNRKVIFYNTTLGAALKGGADYLNKIRHVLNIFKQREEIILLWRPHPLLEATFESMRPQLALEYREIVAEYKRDGFGIYDDTVDLNRAIALSDGYYGDESSVRMLFEAVGKPVMLQSEMIFAERPLAVWFETVCDLGDYFWVTEYGFNAFFQVDKTTWGASYLGSIPGEEDKARLYNDVVAYSDRLIFCPCSANEIAEFDIDKGEFKKIALEYPQADTLLFRSNEQKLWADQKFCKAILHGRYVFFIGQRIPMMVRYDLSTSQLDYYYDWVASIEDGAPLPPASDVRYFFDAISMEAWIIAPSCLTNKVMLFNTDTCISTFRTIGLENWRFSSICFDGKFYWLLPYNIGTPVVRWDLDRDELLQFEIVLAEEGEYSYIRYIDHYVWLMPLRGKRALKINTETLEISTAIDFQKECDNEMSELPTEDSRRIYGFNYVLAKVIGNRLYTLLHKNGVFAEFEPLKSSYRSGNVRMTRSDANLANLPRSFPKSGDPQIAGALVFNESDERSFTDYLSYVSFTKGLHYGDHPTLESAGQRIYNSIKASLL